MRLLCVAMVVCFARVEGAEVSKEYQLKAAFLYNFAKFVDWPTQAFSDTNSLIVVGVYGRNPFGSELEKAVKDRRLSGRAIVVRSVSSPQEAAKVHMLFVPTTEDAKVEALMAGLKGTPILTVGESEAFSNHGGMITFALENEKLRFDINIEPAERSNLKLSAQLQKLARTVRRKP